VSFYLEAAWLGFKALLGLLGISAWFQRLQARRQGMKDQQALDLEAQNRILKAREAVPHPTGNPFEDGKF
jgi:hypothetical protein